MVLFIGNSRLAKLEQQTSDRQNSGLSEPNSERKPVCQVFNNRNITTVPVDIRKEEEKLILLFTLHPIAGNTFI